MATLLAGMEYDMLEQEPARKTTRRTTKSGGNGNADIAPAPRPAAAPVADLPPVPLTAYEQTALEAAPRSA